MPFTVPSGNAESLRSANRNKSNLSKPMNSQYNPDGFPVMRDLTVKQIGEYLENGGKSILLPIGVIEQHGYHLPLSTDALIAEELGKQHRPSRPA